ncbi:hypothetical protein V8B55DRAFT_1501177, partial [Mucor lusitanicus]
MELTFGYATHCVLLLPDSNEHIAGGAWGALGTVFVVDCILGKLLWVMDGYATRCVLLLPGTTGCIAGGAHLVQCLWF